MSNLKEANEIVGGTIDYLQHLIDSGQMKLVMALLQTMERQVMTHAGCKSEKERISLAFAVTAYNHQIETECSPKEAMQYACVEHDKDFDQYWNDNVHNRRWGIGGKVVSLIEWFNIPSEIEFMPKKALANSVGSSSTFRKGQGMVADWQKIQREIKKLKDKQASTEERLKRLEIDSVQKSLSIEEIRDAINLTSQNDREKAEALKNKGFKYSDIALVLGKSEATIKRWFSKKCK